MITGFEVLFFQFKILISNVVSDGCKNVILKLKQKNVNLLCLEIG